SARVPTGSWPSARAAAWQPPSLSAPDACKGVPWQRGRRQRAALRTGDLPAARRRRSLLARVGREGERRLLTADVVLVAARRQPPPRRRLAHLHDLRLDAYLRPQDLAARDRRAPRPAPQPHVPPTSRASPAPPRPPRPTPPP